MGISGSVRDRAESRTRKVLGGQPDFASYITEVLLKYCTGLRRCKRRHRGEVHYQSLKACQEKENKARNQNFAKSSRRAECCCTIGRCPRPNIQNSQFNHGIRTQRRLQGPL